MSSRSSTPQQWGARRRRPRDPRTVLRWEERRYVQQSEVDRAPQLVYSRRTRKAGPRSGRSTCALAAWLARSVATARAIVTQPGIQIRPHPPSTCWPGRGCRRVGVGHQLAAASPASGAVGGAVAHRLSSRSTRRRRTCRSDRMRSGRQVRRRERGRLPRRRVSRRVD